MFPDNLPTVSSYRVAASRIDEGTARNDSCDVMMIIGRIKRDIVSALPTRFGRRPICERTAPIREAHRR